MKTTDLRIGVITMLVFFLTSMGSFVFANGTPTGNPILEIDNQSYHGTYDPGLGHLLTNDISELMCEKVDVDFIGIEVDASSGQGQILIAIYENGNLLTHSGYLTIQGGVDELVGFNPTLNLEMHASNIYTLGVMYSSPDAIYFKTSDTPSQLGPLGYSTTETSIDVNSTFPVLPSTLNGVDSLAFNVGFRIQGSLTTTHTDATVFVTSCGEFNAPSGTATYTADGTYTDVIANAAGCDSIITLHVTINESVYETESVDACSDYTWAENNQTYNTSGIYYAQYVGANGCDSIRVLDLEMHNGSSSVSQVSACEMYTWPENGQSYVTSGIYSVTYQNVLGCDSLVTLDLSVSYPVTNVVSVQSCGPYYWTESDESYANSGIYYVTKFIDGQPCDGFFQLNLTVHPEINLIQSETACGTYTWPVDGNTYSNSGTYNGLITSSTGCDTLVTLDLVINEPVQSVDVVSTCDSTYTWVNGVTYTSNNNTATMVFQTVNGCDSVVTLDLNLYDVQNATETVVSCGPFTWMDGVTYTQTPIVAPNFTHTNSNGCDQVTYLNLTVLEPTSSTNSVTACGAYTWIDGITYSSSNNTATHVLINAAGCDSVVTLDLTIAPIDNSVSVNGMTLTSNQSNAQYQWFEDANGLQIIPGATNQSFTASQNGTYVVEVTQSSCTNISSANIIASAGIDEEIRPDITLSPNPSNGQFKIDGDWVSATLYDLTGRAIAMQSDPMSKQVNASGIATGKYILTVQLSNSEIVVLDVLIE
jgi:hypothetical protein